MTPQTPPVPAPGAIGVERQYFDHLAQGEWRVPRCARCARVVFYPRQVCPHCGGQAFEWFQPSGRGEVYATTVVRRSEAAGGDLNVCLIDLAEGFRLMSRVEGVSPAEVRIGDVVQARLADVDGKALVVFDRCVQGKAA